MVRLTRDQFKRLSRALLDAYPTREEFALLIFQVDNRNLDALSKAANLDIDIKQVIMRATDQRWLADLVTAAAEERENDDELVRLKRELAPISGPVALADPWQASLVNGVPLVDRQPVRDAVRNLDDPGGSRILAVSGPSSSGKSYALNLVAWCASERLDGVVWIDLAKLVDRSATEQDTIGPRKIAEAIREQMRLEADVLPDGGEQDSRWAYAFCNRLQACLVTRRAANPTPARWWIVIDEFNSVPISQQSGDLLKELATRIGRVLTELRLVLVGYSDVLPPGIGAVRRAELTYMTGEELPAYFVDLYAGTGRQPNPDRIAEAIAYVLQRFNPSDPLRMRALGEHVATQTQAILAS